MADGTTPATLPFPLSGDPGRAHTAAGIFLFMPGQMILRVAAKTNPRPGRLRRVAPIPPAPALQDASHANPPPYGRIDRFSGPAQRTNEVETISLPPPAGKGRGGDLRLFPSRKVR